MAKKQNTIRNIIDDFVETVKVAKGENNNAISRLDADNERLEEEISSLKARGAIVGATGSSGEFLKIREAIRKNEDLRDFNELRKQALVKSYNDNKAGYIAKYNKLNNANDVEAMNKILPLFLGIRAIVDEAEENAKQLESVRTLITSGYDGIRGLTPVKATLQGIAKYVNDYQLEKFTELSNTEKKDGK